MREGAAAHAGRQRVGSALARDLWNRDGQNRSHATFLFFVSLPTFAYRSGAVTSPNHLTRGRGGNEDSQRQLSARSHLMIRTSRTA